MHELQYEFSIQLQAPLYIPAIGKLFFEIGTENNAFKKVNDYYFTTIYKEWNYYDDVVFFDVPAATLHDPKINRLCIWKIVCYIKAQI